MVEQAVGDSGQPVEPGSAVPGKSQAAETGSWDVG